MSRLDYAPKEKEIEVTDIQKGLGVFTPKPDKPVSFAALKETLKKAGYTLDAAYITVAGTLARDEQGLAVIAGSSSQRFALAGTNVDQAVAGSDAGTTVEISGDWKTMGTGKSAHETIAPAAQKVGSARYFREPSVAFFAKVSFAEERPSASDRNASVPALNVFPRAPIRVTSPGLTVYKGGAVTPRLYLIHQHLGPLEVDRQAFDVSMSYTPSPRLQVELEAAFSRTAYDNNIMSGSGSGLGNITVWGKYRFFRKVETYGDKQAAFRVGLELPTGQATEPSPLQIDAPAFVRQQLTPINGGLAPHFELAFSKAKGHVIFGGDAEVVFRTERDGFRMGHEQRLSTDLEYRIARDPHKPGGELFLILETMFTHRATGRLNALAVAGSTATEYFLAPGLQWAAHPRLVIEGSYQFPVVRNTGPMVLRTDRNLLLGVKYLF